MILVLRDSLFSSFFGRLFFLTEVYFFWSSLFYLFWLIVTSWCIILLLHPLPCSLRVSPSVSAFSLHLPESTILSSVGGCYRYGVDRPLLPPPILKLGPLGREEFDKISPHLPWSGEWDEDNRCRRPRPLCLCSRNQPSTAHSVSCQ